jgi:hypothetical protein
MRVNTAWLCRYVRHREVVMMVARIGCQLAALFCSTSLASGCCAPNHWAAALLGDVLAAALQLLHLPIGFQVCHLTGAQDTLIM